MKRVLLCLLLLALVVSFSAAAANSPSQAGRLSLFVGYERQHPFSQNIDFDGPVVGIVLPLSDRWFIYSEASFQTETVQRSDFDLNRQQLTLGYRFWHGDTSFWQVELGGTREEFEQSVEQFRGEDSDSGYLGKLGWHYTVNDRHRFSITAQGHLLYETNRYLWHNQYQYYLNRHWSLGARISLGYDEKFQHDLNEYRINLSYSF